MPLFRALLGFGLLAWIGVQAPAARADELAPTAPGGRPLWEIGLFAGVLRYPDYRGSDEYTLYALPLPYLVYRGDYLEADREGVRGVFLRHPHFEFDLSFFGNPPVNGDNDAREGMPELDPLLEAGPALRCYPLGKDRERPLYLLAAVRRVAAVDWEGGLRLSGEGYRGVLQLVHTREDLLGDGRWSGGVSAGVDFGDRDFNRYFYEVEAQEARPERPAYRAEGGYAGFSLAGNLVRELTGRLSLAAYGRWENIAGAVFEESPLVRSEHNLIVGGALIWKLAESERRTAGPQAP
jgi:outer membrane scaffolding protein for murein synthesis (MipA/OmpV family)